LGNTVLPTGLAREGDDYLTPNYGNAESQVEMNAQQGVCQIRIEMQ
jgi:hypothetical protein